MITIRRFEAEILRILHVVFGRSPVEPALELIFKSRDRPKCLSVKALALIEGTLARGCVRKLARLDGWRRSRFLRGDRVVQGRLWERSPLETRKLSFSGESLIFLIHLVADEPAVWSERYWFGLEKLWPAGGPLTLGDSLLLLFTFEAFQDTKLIPFLSKLQVYRSNELCRLAFPLDFAEVLDLDEPSFTNWVEPPRAWVLETLQGWLAGAWVGSECRKRNVTEPARMVRLGGEQTRVIDAYLNAIESSGRRDLARFLLRSARELLRDGKGLEGWNGSLHLQGLNLAGRAEANRAALAILASLDRLRGWELAARDVGFFDEGYAAAQLWKSDWERFGGDELSDLARSLFRSADPLASTT